VTIDEHPPSLGEPNLRRPDKDGEYGFEAWSVLCTTCGYEWIDKEWAACPRCIERLEADHGRFDDYLTTAQEPSPPPGEQPPEDYDDILKAMLVDWDEFWNTDHNDAEWLAEPLIAAKRSTAMFAPGGTGKSLLALYMAACIATGTKLFGRPIPPRHVLYLDYEMTADDLAERLEGMGFDDTCDLTRLHYALLPSLPGLDEPEGGKAVVRLADMCNAELVIIDTFGRAVHGDENDADTVRSWYRWTGMHLKHAGRAFLRVDHAGKDIAKGQRGTSAKNDDVDVVWQMAAKEGGAFTFTAKKRRMGWVPLSVDIVMHEDHRMHFELLAGHTWQKGTAELAGRLDDLKLPTDVTKRAARAALKDADIKVRDTVLGDALKYRKERSLTYHFASDLPVDNSPEMVGTTSGTTPSDEVGNQAGNHSPAETVKPLLDDRGNHFGNHREPLPDVYGNQCGERSEPHGSHVTDEATETDPDRLQRIADTEGF